MGRLTKNSLFELMNAFFTVFLPNQRCVSPNTLKAYKNAMNNYLDYISDSTGKPLGKFDFCDFQQQNADAFFQWMKSVKQYSPSTINQKMAGIREFLSYASSHNPELIVYLKAFSAIPFQKTDAWASIKYMSENAVNTILRQPDTSTHQGFRDFFYMVMLYDTAARVDEMKKICICDVHLAGTPTVILHGKGNITRIVPLMENTILNYKKYKFLYHPDETAYSKLPLFYTKRNGSISEMSDDNVRRFMNKYGTMARAECLEVPENIYPHLWRHSRAMHLYQHGMDLTLISQWLGHSSLETTLVYAHADTEKKRKAINKAMENTSIATPDAALFKVDNDEELLKKLCGLK